MNDLFNIVIICKYQVSLRLELRFYMLVINNFHPIII